MSCVVCCCFQNLSLIVLAIGVLFSVFFHLGTREAQAGGGEDEEGGDEGERTPLLTRSTLSSPSVALRWRDWLKEPSFYQVCAVGQSAPSVFKLFSAVSQSALSILQLE